MVIVCQYVTAQDSAPRGEPLTDIPGPEQFSRAPFHGGNPQSLNTGAGWEFITDYPGGQTGLYGGSVYVMVNDTPCVMVFGGYNNITLTGQNDVWCWNTISNTWSQKPSMPGLRFYHHVAAVQGKVYIISGTGSAGTAAPVDSVHEYDPVTETYALKSPIPVPRNWGGVGVYQDQFIYIVGGSTSGTATYVNDVLFYDPIGDVWAQITNLGTPFTPRRSHSVSVVNGPDSSFIVVAGGFGTSPSFKPDAYEAKIDLTDPLNLNWVQLPNIPAEGVPGNVYNGQSRAAGATVGVEHLVIGGEMSFTPADTTFRYSKQIHAWNTVTKSWSRWDDKQWGSSNMVFDAASPPGELWHIATYGTATGGSTGAAGTPVSEHYAIPPPPVGFYDNFDSYAAGQQLACQNPTDWTTWSLAPCNATEDPMVSSTRAYSGSNSTVIVQNNDLVKTFGSLTSGMYRISFMVYVPATKAGYFNTLAGFTPNPFSWGMEVYFDAGGGGRLLSVPATTNFTFAHDIWQRVEVIVDLDSDMAEFWFSGALVNRWQWTRGGSIPLRLDANDFFGATANDEMYFDNYRLEQITAPGFSDNFDAYTAGQQLACQNPIDWTTWTLAPCNSTEDAVVSSNFAYSGTNSTVVVQNNDLVKRFGGLTKGRHAIEFQVYIPATKAGYFNTLAGFTPNPFSWGMEVYFDAGGAGRLLSVPATTNFTWTPDTWQPVKVVVDLDADMAEFHFNGTMVNSWQWTRGGSIPRRLDANDFFGATANDEMYFDDYVMKADSVTVDVEDDGPQDVPVSFALDQNYPNPFNPTTVIRYALPGPSSVTLKIYNVLGQQIAELVNDVKSAGFFQTEWNGRNQYGQLVSSGVYFYRMEAHATNGGNVFVSDKKMLMLK